MAVSNETFHPVCFTSRHSIHSPHTFVEDKKKRADSEGNLDQPSHVK